MVAIGAGADESDDQVMRQGLVAYAMRTGWMQQVLDAAAADGIDQPLVILAMQDRDGGTGSMAIELLDSMGLAPAGRQGTCVAAGDFWWLCDLVDTPGRVRGYLTACDPHSWVPVMCFYGDACLQLLVLREQVRELAGTETHTAGHVVTAAQTRAQAARAYRQARARRCGR